jgi:hypothetical protein
MKLDWSDLLIEPKDETDLRECIRPWQWLVGGQVAPLFFNRFGCSFLLRPEGHVEMLDVFSGEVERVAASHQQFVASVNEPAWQEVYLLSKQVHLLHEQGKIARANECYAIAPHPALGGPNPFLGESLSPARVIVMDCRVWQSICSQALGHEA